MKFSSFRFRIALLSTFLAGSALVGFATASGWLIYKAKLARLDSEIKSQLQRESAPPPRPLSHWQPYEDSLPTFFGTPSRSMVVFQVLDGEGKKLHQSAHWPQDLDVAALFPPLSAASSVPPASPLGPRPGMPREGQPQQPPQPPYGSPNPWGDPNHPPPPGWQPGQPLDPPPEIPLHQWHQLSKVVTQRLATATWRVGVVTSPSARIAIAVKFDQIDREMSVIRNIFFVSIPVVLILVAIGAWVFSGSALKPIHEVAATIKRVTAKGLDQRIPMSAADVEFLELIQVFNQMMERLERSFKQASRFSADAAHELKTPLAILQGELERMLQQADLGSETQQSVSNLLDEVRHLGSIVRKLLLLSLADAGQMRLHWMEVNLSEILADLADDIEMFAPHLVVELKVAPLLKIKGDRDLLIQVLQNMISNAIKYNLPQGWIKIETRHQGTTLAITVTNASKDIPVKERERIFERFHRGDATHCRNIEGLGLGLSLSREIARSHKGDLKLDRTPSGQTAFTLTLPFHQKKAPGF